MLCNMIYAAAYKGFILYHIREKHEYITSTIRRYIIFCLSKIYHLRKIIIDPHGEPMVLFFVSGAFLAVLASVTIKPQIAKRKTENYPVRRQGSFFARAHKKPVQAVYISGNL